MPAAQREVGAFKAAQPPAVRYPSRQPASQLQQAPRQLGRNVPVQGGAQRRSNLTAGTDNRLWGASLPVMHKHLAERNGAAH